MPLSFTTFTSGAVSRSTNKSAIFSPSQQHDAFTSIVRNSTGITAGSSLAAIAGFGAGFVPAPITCSRRTGMKSRPSALHSKYSFSFIRITLMHNGL